MAIRRWILVSIGLVVALMVACGGLVGAGVYLVSRQMEIEHTDARAAEAAFTAVRAEFTDSRPLIELRDGEPRLTPAYDERITTYSGPLPESLHLLIWDEDEEELVRFSLPFWILRLSPHHPIHVPDSRASETRVSIEDLDLTPGDLAAAGPALVLDTREDGTHLLLWTR